MSQFFKRKFSWLKHQRWCITIEPLTSSLFVSQGLHFISYVPLIGLPSFFFSSARLCLSKLPPSPAIPLDQAAIAADWTRLRPRIAAGVLMNSSRLLNEDLLKRCRLLVWHFRASGGVLNCCLRKCHSLTLRNGWPYELKLLLGSPIDWKWICVVLMDGFPLCVCVCVYVHLPP